MDLSCFLQGNCSNDTPADLDTLVLRSLVSHEGKALPRMLSPKNSHFSGEGPGEAIRPVEQYLAVFSLSDLNSAGLRSPYYWGQCV